MSAQNLEHLPLAALTPYAANSRTHSGDQVRQIARSIEEFGFTNPVLIDADGGIIAGHGRVQAAQLLGLATVPCLRLAHLSPEQKRAYIIADNQLALNAGKIGKYMIGMSVPPKMTEAVARAVIDQWLTTNP
jgi:ParB-like chromosome segregation protein Spo0J